MSHIRYTQIINILARRCIVTDDNNNHRTCKRVNAIIKPDLPSTLTSSKFVISCLLLVTCARSRNLPSRVRTCKYAYAYMSICMYIQQAQLHACTDRYTDNYVTGLTMYQIYVYMSMPARVVCMACNGEYHLAILSESNEGYSPMQVLIPLIQLVDNL